MIHLAYPKSFVTVRRKMLWQRDELAKRRHIPKPRGESVDTGGRWTFAREKARPRGRTPRCLSVGICEQRTTLGKPVHVRGDARAAEPTDLVVEVVNQDEEHVETIRRSVSSHHVAGRKSKSTEEARTCHPDSLLSKRLEQRPDLAHFPMNQRYPRWEMAAFHPG